jgi:hypothetical protein
MSGWAAFLNGGNSTQTFEAFVLGSPEYYQVRGGGTNDGFLNALYQDVLGRAAEPGALSGWEQQLAGGMSRTTVALMVLTSPEGLQDRVQGWYQLYLHRSAGPGELQGWVAALQANTSPELVQAQIVGSDEYLLRLTETQGDVVTDWTDVLLNAIRTDRTPPPMASRAMAMVETAMYDAVDAVAPDHALYDPGAVIAGLPTTAMPGTSREAAAAEAAYTVLVSLYPAQQATFDAALAASLADVPDGVSRSDGIDLGKAVANAILAWRANDGASQKVTYTPGTTAPDWQPTPGPTPATNFQPALLPQWPQLTPFAMTGDAQFRPPPPPAPGTPDYTAALNEVTSYGQDTSTVRTADQTQIALFWADNPDGKTSTPPGHWLEIAEQIGELHTDTLGENARLLALTGIALADAGIVAWDAKFTYNFWRPITAINNLENVDPTTVDYSQLAWRPLLATPNFPTYISGHSTFSAAAAAVLTRLFGDNVPFTATSDSLPGVTRSYSSFFAAAEEAGQSRIYAGIHFQFDNTAGRNAGTALGNYVSQTFLT